MIAAEEERAKDASDEDAELEAEDPALVPPRAPRSLLSIVATPIGNLEDVTLRALRVLRDVSVVAAEDTRRTARLLQHYSISTPTTSLHEHNERQKTPALGERLSRG